MIHYPVRLILLDGVQVDLYASKDLGRCLYMAFETIGFTVNTRKISEGS